MQSRLDRSSLAECLGSNLSSRSLRDPVGEVSLSDVLEGTVLSGKAQSFAESAVLISLGRQLETTLALIELDGIARRILIAPPDLAPAHRAAVIADAGIDVVITDDFDAWHGQGATQIISPLPLARIERQAVERAPSQWLMLTSGTTGRPKIVAHTLAGLTGSIKADASSPVWSTFYDIRRYGGLQILLRALLGNGSMVFSDPGEPIAKHIARMIEARVTHVSGTPSHWRKALMSDALRDFKPDYVRLSGEIADQAVLDSLRKALPAAAIAHAYASTEAGVAFAVEDGLEGFPARMLGEAGPVKLKVVDGTLFIHSSRAALGYVGAETPVLLDGDGYVDTGDMVELRGDRYHFVGRRSGIINVGGLKVNPEEVESVINRHDFVEMSRVKARRSPIIGAFVVADVVLKRDLGDEARAAAKDEIAAHCRARLPAHKVPAMIAVVPAIDVSSNGKVVRNVA